MARDITAIETSIKNNELIKDLEYTKDYFAKKYNLLIDTLDGELQKIHAHVTGLDKIVLNPNNLIDFDEDILFFSGATPGEGILRYRDTLTGLLRTDIKVDVALVPGVTDTFVYKSNINIKKRIEEVGTNFGGTFELDGSSISYSNPTNSAKNFRFVGDAGENYKVEFIEDKIVISISDSMRLEVDGAPVLAAAFVDGKYTIDTPADFWGTNGEMKITFQTAAGTLVEGGRALKLESLVHPHNLKEYAWQTMDELKHNQYDIMVKDIASESMIQPMNDQNIVDVQFSMVTEADDSWAAFKVPVKIHIVDTDNKVIYPVPVLKHGDADVAFTVLNPTTNQNEQYLITTHSAADGVGFPNSFHIQKNGATTALPFNFKVFMRIATPKKISALELHFDPSTPGGTDGATRTIVAQEV